MPHPLIDLNPDLKKLWDEGLEIEIKGGYLLVHSVPYVNQNKTINYGTLVTALNMAGDKTVKPQTHVIEFQGEHPCNKDGSIITQIQHTSVTTDFGNGIIINHSFSNKPIGGYLDYYEKITRYIEIISAPAKSLDNTVTEKTFNVIDTEESISVFKYIDTNSSRAEINSITLKLQKQKIAIIGLGGTGSYILDLIAKTPVSEIHMYDGDYFLQHNAFRSPGAPSIERLKERLFKTDYFANIYSNMHRVITPHSYNINASNVKELADMDFVFISIDKGEPKRQLIAFLETNGISFIDVGMGIQLVDGKLIGILRTTLSTNDKRDHILGKNRISFSDGVDDEYSTNIQIADLNALNACLAVIKWKKLYGFYQDLENEYFTTYTINTAHLNNEDHI